MPGNRSGVDAGELGQSWDATFGGQAKFPADLSSMDWESLNELRLKYQNDPMAQQVLAPLEHQAYVREQTQQNPVAGAVMGAVLEPGYQLAKKVGLFNGQGATPASMDQVLGSLKGVKQGIFGQ